MILTLYISGLPIQMCYYVVGNGQGRRQRILKAGAEGVLDH